MMRPTQKITKKIFESALNDTQTLSGACLKCGLTDSNTQYFLNKMGWTVHISYNIIPIKNPVTKRKKTCRNIDIQALQKAFDNATPIPAILESLGITHFTNLKSALKTRGFTLSKIFKVKVEKESKKIDKPTKL